MAIKIRIPTPLRTLTNGVDIAEVAGTNVAEVLGNLTAKFDGMDKRLFKQPGELNRFVNIYVNDEDIRFLDNLTTPIKDGDDVSIVPAIAGG
jgi:molybdopterin synthase sulfur carrier subunit